MNEKEMMQEIAERAAEFQSRQRPEPESKFWTVNIGHILTIAVLVGGWAVQYGTQQQRMLQMETSQTEFKNLVARIDERGTSASQRVTYADAQLLEAQERRLQKLEEIHPRLIGLLDAITNRLGKDK